MRRLWFATHKWVSFVVGLQILAWMVSGLYMTFVPIERVRGEHNTRKPEVDLRAAADISYPLKAIKGLEGPVTRVELADVLGQTVWRVEVDGKPAHLLDASSGAVLSPLDEARAREIALGDFAGKAGIASATLITKDPPIEYRSALPAWQIVLDDPDSTHLYVGANSGKVVARRNGTWRLYDFLWSLHIMDYRDREDFNNWLVVMAALAGLVLTVSGFAILFYRFLVPRR